MTTTVLPAASADDGDLTTPTDLPATTDLSDGGHGSGPDEVQEGFVGLGGSSLSPMFAPEGNLRFEYADPNLLIDNPRNLRTAVADVEDLKASMAVVGILCPLVVVPVDGEIAQLMIMIGHRRKYAAIDLGFPLVPVIIAPDEGAAKLIIAQLAENGDRVGLSPTEEAEGFHQLTLLDWSPEKIAKVRNTSAAKVKQALALRTLPEAARAAADTGALTLDDAAVMAEFTDQPAAMNRILKSASSGWGFRHAVATERSKQAYASAKERVKAELVLAGVKITAKPKGWGYGGDCKAVEVNRLVDADGQRLEVEQVRTRPGFAAWIDKIGDNARAVYYCTDPEEYGYKRRAITPAYGGLSPEEKARREQADLEKAAHREALTVASGVRADFYRQIYKTSKMIKKLFPEALREAVVTPGGFFEDVDGLYADLGGVEGKALAAAKEDLLRRCLVVKWVIRQECNLRQAQKDGYSYLDDDAAAAWLDQLVADGYTLSDAEAQLRQDIDDAREDETLDDEDDGDELEDAEDDGDVVLEDENEAVVDEPVVSIGDTSQEERLAEVVALPTGRADDEPQAQAA